MPDNANEDLNPQWAPGDNRYKKVVDHLLQSDHEDSDIY